MINKGKARIAYKAIQDVTNICDNIRHNVTIMGTRLRSLSG